MGYFGPVDAVPVLYVENTRHLYPTGAMATRKRTSCAS